MKRNFLFNLFIVKSNVSNQNKKASMLFLSKEATNKGQQLKTQMLLSFQNDGSKGSEKIWLESGFFGDQRAELTILKANFQENMLCYINQGTVSLAKGGKKSTVFRFRSARSNNACSKC